MSSINTNFFSSVNNLSPSINREKGSIPPERINPSLSDSVTLSSSNPSSLEAMTAAAGFEPINVSKNQSLEAMTAAAGFEPINVSKNQSLEAMTAAAGFEPINVSKNQSLEAMTAAAGFEPMNVSKNQSLEAMTAAAGFEPINVSKNQSLEAMTAAAGFEPMENFKGSASQTSPSVDLNSFFESSFEIFDPANTTVTQPKKPLLALEARPNSGKEQFGSTVKDSDLPTISELEKNPNPEQNFYASRHNPTSPEIVYFSQSLITQSKEFAESLSQEEKDIVKTYTHEGNAYKNINSYLRGMEPLKEEHKNVFQTMNTIMNKTSIPENITVHRFTTLDSLGELKDLPDDKLIGKTINEPAFMSTTVRNDFNYKWSGSSGLELKINVPPGAKGAMIDRLSDLNEEKEVLFAPGSKMVITGITRTDFSVQLTVDMLPSKENK